MNSRFSLAPAIYAVLLMVPIYWLVTLSIKTSGEISGGFTLYSHAPTAANYQFILTDSDWSYGYINALIYVSINVVISVGVAIPAAYAFSRFRFPGDRPLFFGLLMFRMLAPPILLVPFVQIFSDLRLIDTHIAVAIAHCFFNVPLAIWILEGFISSVPAQIDESARIDGFGFGRYFFRILLPIIAPGIAVAAFFCFMFSWVEFLLANALTTVHAKPIAGIMTRAASVLSANVSLISAASVLGLIPGILLIVFMRNHLARGFSMGRMS